MAETIPGGAYLRSDGVTWQDANGKVIDAPSKKELAAADKAAADNTETQAAGDVKDSGSGKRGKTQTEG